MQALHLAADAGCRKLVLFHHHPDHDDDGWNDAARSRGNRRRLGRVEVELASEGLPWR